MINYAIKTKDPKHVNHNITKQHWTDKGSTRINLHKSTHTATKHFFSQHNIETKTSPPLADHSHRTRTTIDTELQNITNKKQSEHTQKALSLAHIDKYANTFRIYTDGCKDIHKNTGCAVYIPETNTHLHYKLQPNSSIMSAELTAIQKAVNWCTRNTQTIAQRHVTILSDSLSSLKAMQNPKHQYTNNIITQIQDALNKTDIPFNLVWIPAHCGIKGNEEADKQAKIATLSATETALFKYTAKEHKKLTKAYTIAQWQQYKDTNQQGSLHYLIQTNTTLKPKYTNPNRLKEILISRIRMGRTLTNKTLHQMKKRDNATCNYCNQTDTLQHYLLECQSSPLATDIREACRVHKVNLTRSGNPAVAEVCKNTHIQEIIYNHQRLFYTTGYRWLQRNH